MREVSHDLIDKLIHYDPEHAIAFIAIAEASGRMLGVVRLHDDANGEGAGNSPFSCVRDLKVTVWAGY